MKVISLKEPWASLVREKIKKMETRSWNTKYRGELYIHASKSKVNLKDKSVNELVDLLKDKDFKYGYIIAKCNLVDTMYMNEQFVNKMKENKTEYKCGLYEVGRYAWILEDIEVLEKPIEINGKLSIWNY